MIQPNALRPNAFARYFLARFFKNVFVINIGLTLLFNLVEFFEKMVRVKQTSSKEILIFIALNCIPSFFENLPVSSWLGSCMTIKEIGQQNEWEILKLLNIGLNKIFFLLLIAGTLLFSVSFFGKEIFTQHIAKKAEIFKYKKFKQNRHTKLFNQWFLLDNKTFCYFKYLDLDKKSGTGFYILELSPKFKIREITSAQHFSVTPDAKEIFIQSGQKLSTRTRVQKILKNKAIYLPGFFAQLKINRETPSLKQMFHVVMFDSKILPKHIYHQLLYLFLTRILEHLLLLLYPLLTFSLFFLVSSYYKWVLIFIPYPLTTLLFTTTDTLLQIFQFGTIAFIPYVILSALTMGLYYAIRKKGF
jgi:hypothetical protein